MKIFGIQLILAYSFFKTNKMNKLIIYFSVFLFSVLFHVNAQENCGIDQLNYNEKTQLNYLLKKLRRGIESKNKIEISNLCNFPFYCSFCHTSPLTGKNIISRSQFIKEYCKNIFDQPLLTVLKKKKPLQILKGFYVKKDRRCLYRFLYTSIEPSKESEGQQICLYIKKIKKSFKIVSAATIP